MRRTSQQLREPQKRFTVLETSTPPWRNGSTIRQFAGGTQLYCRYREYLTDVRNEHRHVVCVMLGLYFLKESSFSFSFFVYFSQFSDSADQTNLNITYNLSKQKIMMNLLWGKEYVQTCLGLCEKAMQVIYKTSIFLYHLSI